MSSITSRRGIPFILVTLVLDAMGIGLIVPVMPDLIAELEGGSVGEAAIWGGILLTTFSVMQFLAGPTLGSLSDRFGRRPVLLISLLVMTIDYLIMGLTHSIWMVLLTRVIGGVTAATQSTAAAYIADISDDDSKSANFGLVGAAFGLGFVLGPVMGGFLAEFGLRAPFFAAAALSLLNLLYGMFVLPETVTDRTRRAFSWRRANPLGAFRAIGHLPDVRRFLLLVFLYEFALMVYPAIWAYFPKERYGWDPAMVGLSLMLFGISMALVQGVLIRLALKWMSAAHVVIFGLAFEMAAFVVLTQLTSGLHALILIPLSALGAVVSPIIQGRMSSIARDDQQGELQGVIASTRSVAAIFAPLVMTQLFWRFTTGDGPYIPGAPFWLSAALMLLCLVLFITRTRRRQKAA